MFGATPFRAFGLLLMPWLAAAGFPPAGNFFGPGRQLEDIYPARRRPDPFDESQGLEPRARAYLDLHCSACHKSGGVLRGSLDLNFETSLERTGLFAPSARRGPEGFLPRVRPGRPGESELYRRLASTGNDAMPPLGRTSRDERGVDLIRSWIESLSGGSSIPSTSPPSASPPTLPGAETAHPRAPRTAIHRLSRLEAAVFLPKAEGDPDAPPAVRVCDVGGHCRDLAAHPASVADDADKGWEIHANAPLARGLYPLFLRWPGGQTGRRILLVL